MQPEGSPQFFNKALLVDLRNPNSKKIDQTVKIVVPQDAVPGSTSVMLSAIGEILLKELCNTYTFLSKFDVVCSGGGLWGGGVSVTVNKNAV